MILSSLNLVALLALALGDAFVVPPSPLQHHVISPKAFDQTAADIVRQRTASDTPPNASHLSSSLLVKAAVGEEVSAAEGRSSAKQRFLRNLERKRGGEDVPSSVLDADLTLLRSPGGGANAATTTAVTAVDSWRGKWEICYAPHIETLGKVILTKFGTVEYIFDADDGRMVSHAGYESKVFGSGWFNADGRVVPVPPASSASGCRPTDVRDEARQDVVRVVFERFWWDRNADDRPTGAPPGATADGAAGGGATVVDWFVQAAGKAMFFDGLSVFPVRYLDDDLCVFEFKAAGTVVASLRVG